MAINNDATRTAQDLQGLRELLNGARTDDNVRGRKLKDGSIQLYLKPNGSAKWGILGRLGRNKARATAREGITRMFEKHARDTGRPMTTSVRNAIDAGFAKDVKAGALSLLATTAHSAKLEQESPGIQGKTLSSLGVSPSLFQDAVREAMADKAAGKDEKSIADALGKKLAGAVMANSPDAAQRDAFSVSTGGAFKQELWEACDEAGSQIDENFLDDVYNAAAYGVARNRLEENGDLRIDDQIYRKQSHLGHGGGGTVDAYARVDDPDDRIAFKVSIAPGTEGNVEMVKEVKNHEIAQGEGHANVLDSKGGIRLPDGKIGMAMDVCPLGDMDGAIAFLDEAVARGDIQPGEAFSGKVTLLHDTMKGMAAVEGNGLEHRDYKPGNVFIDGTGTARVADFGEARTTNDNRWLGDGASSPFYAAPETESYYNVTRETKESVADSGTKVLSSAKPIPQEPGSQATDAKSSGGNPMRAAMDETLRKQMPNLSEKDREALIKEHNGAFAEETAGRTLKMNKRDAFAVGATGFKLLYGTDVGRGASKFDFYKSLAANPERRFVDVEAMARTGTDGALSGEQRLGRLVNDMTTFDPSKRKDIRSALGDELFRSPGVGTPETRNLIRMAIESGTERKAEAKAQAAAREAARQEVGASPAFSNGAPQSAPLLRPAMQVGLAEQVQAELDDARRYMTR